MKKLDNRQVLTSPKNNREKGPGGRSPRTRDDVQKQVAIDTKLFTHEELVSAVCKFFCNGHPVSQIGELVRARYNVKLGREDPWRMLGWAASKNWLQAVSPLAYDLAERFQKQHEWLKRIDVVNSCTSDDVSYRVASLLLELIREFHSEHPDDKEVHVGFAGGSALKKTAASCARLLREDWRELPSRIVFHAMVANFNLKDPTTDPNAFFTYLSADAGIPVKTGFVSLLAPGFVKSELRQQLIQIDEVQEAMTQASEIDIFVTSAGGHWEQGHSELFDMYHRKSPESLDVLRVNGCVGDLSWLPISLRGPIEIETEFRAVTLMELKDLETYIRNRKKVVLMLGPCGECGRPKDDVLQAILEMRPHLITHLVAESRVIRAVLN